MDAQTIDLLSTLAGVAGFCLSLFLAISNLLKNRIIFELSVLDYTQVNAISQFFVSIVNKSYSPLVITEIEFCGIICELEPKKIRNNPEDWNGVTTPRFPLCIPARSAQLVYLEFVGCKHSPLVADTWVTFQIQTISRRESRSVLLPGTGHYLHIR